MKKVALLLVVLLLLGGITMGIWYYFIPLEVENVSYSVNGDVITATIKVKNAKENTECIINDKIYNLVDNECSFEVENKDSNVVIQNALQRVEQEISPNVNQVVDFTLSENKIYLVLEEEKEITFSAKTLGNPKEDIVLTSKDESIARTDKNKIIGVAAGNTIVEAKVGEVTKNIEVVVTDLITKPVWKGQDKPRLTCHVYSEEQAKLLDELLYYRVEQAGLGTRAGAVAAARFLTLELPYRVPYFYENGRLDPKTAVHIVDGEGRYYKRGLYLADSKFEGISSTWKGPAIWGCPLMNLEDDPESSYYPGQMRGNGLDCSGFIRYASKNSINVALPRTAQEMYNCMEKISASEREPGDLVFFKSSGRIDHVGIYLGRYTGGGSLHGREIFINAASQGPRTGVVVSALDEPYWRRHYNSSARFLPSSMQIAQASVGAE